MPKKQLPEYTVIVRWGVQDVVNWLAVNGFQDCVKTFREHAVDGEKLFHIQDNDLKKIQCPSQKSKELMKIVNKIKVPANIDIVPKHISLERFGSNRGPQPPATQAPRAPVPTYNPHPISDDESSENDFTDDDFSDEDDGPGLIEEINYEDPNSPPPPPRPGPRIQAQVPQTRAPAVPVSRHAQNRPPVPTPVQEPEQEENYEEPDAAIRNFHPGPLPKLPTSSSAPPTVLPQRSPAPIPSRTRPPPKLLPPTPPVDDQPMYEVTDPATESQPLYEDPHKEEDEPPPPLPPSRKPITKTGEVSKELYEDPLEEQAPTPPPPARKGHAAPPPPVIQEESYMEMNAQPAHAMPPPPRANKAPTSWAPAIPTAREPAPVPVPQPLEQEENYVEPSQDAPPLPVSRNHRKKSDPKTSGRGPEPRSHGQHNGRHVVDELEGRPWYFGLIDRNETRNLLERYKEDGMYLIRKSTKDASKPYTLVLWYKDIYNLQIKLTNGGYVLGTADLHVFKTLDEMLEFFGKNYLVLKGTAGEAQLKRPVPKY